MRRIGYSVGTTLSVLLLMASWLGWIQSSLVESLGFVTGAWCVWLTVKEHIWNFPIGIANSVFYLFLFLQSRLFADSTLQAIYIVLGFWGWYWWLKGGKNKTELHVSKMPAWEWLALAVITVAATCGMDILLVSRRDAAPFLDAFTTVLSLVAQYMLTRKYLENWWIWISADVIYVGLYGFRALYLTAILYALFIGLCMAGYRAWMLSLKNGPGPDMELVHA